MWHRKVLLAGTCFLSGGCILVMEICGMRLMAPVFGNALYSWTSLIGVILLAVAIGDYVGGWLIDRFRSQLLIPGLLVLASLYMILAFYYAGTVGEAVGPSYAWGPMLGSFLLFFCPALLLSAITPVSVRLFSLANSDQCIGISSGTIGMCSTLGSFTGTILSGFVIVPFMDIEFVLVDMALLLTSLAILFCTVFRVQPKESVQIVGLVTLVIGSALFKSEYREPGVIFTRQSSYQKVRVKDELIQGDIRRSLLLDRQCAAAIWLKTGEPAYRYQLFWKLLPYFSEKVSRVAVLGAGGYVIPEKLADYNPDCTLDVVDIDPVIPEVGRSFFSLNQYPRIKPITQDARRFLLGSTGSYDVIVADCYNGSSYIPPHLLTKEFFALVRSRLTPGGVLMLNTIVFPRGEKDDLYQAICATLHINFPYIRVFVDSTQKLDQQAHNALFYCSNQPLNAKPHIPVPGEQDCLADEIPLELRQGVQPITDFRNPVDLLVLKQWW